MAKKQEPTADQMRKELGIMCKGLNDNELLWLYTHLTIEALKRGMLPAPYGEIVALAFDKYLTNQASKN